MPRPPAQKVVVLWLCKNLTLQTDGSTDDSFVTVDLPEAEDWGPYLEAIRPMTITRNRTTNFRWKPMVQWSLDGATYATPADLCANVTANGQAIQAAFTDASELGLKLQFGLACSNGTGTAVEQGIVSAALVFIFRT